MNVTYNFRLGKFLAYGLAGLGLCSVANPSLAVPAGAQIDMKLLVIAATDDNPNVVGDAPQLEAVKAILDRIGIPYDIAVAPTSLTLEDAATNHAKYQGILLAISNAQYMNPLTGAATAQAIASYQFKYNVRLASFYTWPGDTGCLQAPGSRDTTASPLDTTLTPAGTAAFPYLNAGTSSTNPLRVEGAWTYFAAAANPLPAGTTVTPLLQAVAADNMTYSVASVCSFTNATPQPGDSPTREILALTFDNNPYLIHSITLSYGVINWLTKGIFLGDRHVYLDPQVDDVGISADIFPYTLEPDGWYRIEQKTTTRTFVGDCPLGATNPQTGTTPCEYRITGNDYKQLIAWQRRAQSSTPNAGALRLNMVYNGAGFTKKYGGLGLYPEDNPATIVNENETLDTLTAQVKLNSSDFKWTSHTYDHENMDAMLYNTLFNSELKPNHTARNNFGFAKYTKNALVTPDVSGLYNSDTMRAAADFGISYLISDTSRPTPPVGSGCVAPQSGTGALPAPNTGKYNCLEQRIYEVPRYPTSLFYNVSTPAEWTAEYNHFYGLNGIDPTGWGSDQTYAQVLDRTSEVLVSYLLNYDLRPLMFHQTNLRAYDGTKSLLGDLIDATLVKYNKYYKNLPIRSPGLKDTGDLMKQRMVYNESAVTGVLTPGQSIVLRATRNDGKTVVVPVTGVSFGTSKETYGGQSVSFITLNPTNGYTTAITPAPAW